MANKLNPEALEYFRKQGARGGKIGAKARMEKLTPERRSEIAKQAVQAREAKRKVRNQMSKTKRTVIIVVPGKVSRSELKKIAQNPVLLDDDQADYQYSMAAIREGGKPVSAESILKKYGRRVDR